MISTQDVETLPGTPVLDSDGDKVGDVAQVYVSDDGAEPLFVTVKTGLFGTKETFVPLDSATLVQGALHVRFDKAVIKDAPRVEADEHLSDAEQGSLFDYYDQHSSGSDSGRDAGTTDSTAPIAGTRATDDGGTYDTRDAGYGTDATTDSQTASDFAGTTDADASRTVDQGTGTADARTSAQGYDTSGPTTDEAMTLSEERMKVGVQQVESGRARLRKHIVTEQRTVTVPVTHEEVRIEREPITDANIGSATDGPELSEEEHEIVLTEERPVVDTETVPVERVRLTKDAVTEQQDVTGQVRREELDTDGIDGAER